MIKTVIFDVDGTLYDYNSCHEIGMKALEQYCRRRFRRFRKSSGRSMVRHIEKKKSRSEAELQRSTIA